MDAGRDVSEFFPPGPLLLCPLVPRPAGQRADRGEIGKVIGVTHGVPVPVPTLADQSGLEVPEPVRAARAAGDQVGGTPHGIGVDRPPRGIQVGLEVDDVSPGDAAEPVLQPLEPLLRTVRLAGRALQEEPEIAGVHVGNSKDPGGRQRSSGGHHNPSQMPPHSTRALPPIGAVPGVGLVVGCRAQKRAFGLLRVLLVAGVAGS